MYQQEQNRLYPTSGIAAYRVKLFQMTNEEVERETKNSLYGPQYIKAAKKELEYRRLEATYEQPETIVRNLVHLQTKTLSNDGFAL